MAEQTPWQPPADYVYPDEVDYVDQDVARDPEEPPAPPPAAEPPPIEASPAGQNGIRSGVVAVALALVIVMLGGTVLYVGITGRGDGPSTTAPSSGDGSGRPPLKRPKVPEGYQLFADSDGSFAFVVPDGWQTVLLDPTSVRRARARLDDEDPPVAAALGTADRQLADSGGLAFAAESHDVDGSLAHVTLVLTPRSTESLSQIAAEGTAAVEASGGSVQSSRAVTIGDREGVIANVTLDTDQGPTTHELVYVVSGFRIYLLSLDGVDATTARHIAASLRVP
jgi:hypothetical protein